MYKTWVAGRNVNQNRFACQRYALVIRGQCWRSCRQGFHWQGAVRTFGSPKPAASSQAIRCLSLSAISYCFPIVLPVLVAVLNRFLLIFASKRGFLGFLGFGKEMVRIAVVNVVTFVVTFIIRTFELQNGQNGSLLRCFIMLIDVSWCYWWKIYFQQFDAFYWRFIQGLSPLRMPVSKFSQLVVSQGRQSVQLGSIEKFKCQTSIKFIQV